MFALSYRILICMAAVALSAGSCTPTVGVFEKNITIPKHEWNQSFKPEISFDVTDTASLYNIYVVLRHTDAYRYNNIWMNLYVQVPQDTTFKNRIDLRLATDDKGWLGSGMDDVYEHRILVNKDEPRRFVKPGKYIFRLENIMRDEPLEHVMNVGIRIEKARA